MGSCCYLPQVIGRTSSILRTESVAKDGKRRPRLWRLEGDPGHARTLSGGRLSERGALRIVKRRWRAAGLPADVSCHLFRATGITLHQDAKGDMEAAR